MTRSLFTSVYITKSVGVFCTVELQSRNPTYETMNVQHIVHKISYTDAGLNGYGTK